jgi:hypothetical protein
MPSLRITGVRTVNQLGQNATLFDPFGDGLALTLDIAASADLLALPSPAWSAAFQIIQPRTDTVVLEQTWGGSFNWGQWFWISLGNNWGPPAQYTTIQKWGLNWAGSVSQSIFGFRGIIKASYIPTTPPGSGWHAVDAFDVSPIRCFRAKEVYAL